MFEINIQPCFSNSGYRLDWKIGVFEENLTYGNAI